MKNSIAASLAITKGGATETIAAEITFCLSNAALLKAVAQRALTLDNVRQNASAESIHACNAAFGGILYVAGGPAAMAVKRVRIDCSAGRTCPDVAIEGNDMAIKPHLTIELLKELADADAPDLPKLDVEVACDSCGGVELAAFRKPGYVCNFCGQPHTELMQEAA
ncbi:MAG: hypothetical protein Q8K31_02430 [Burkholderiaceae bacterium]|nr:hypothetical protein [Burkholderiaceae bacterium]MDP1968030.1 hypothetical protein [Burkholderiaceae bacterium]MDP3136092.1 hypothetical protein [Burkholderiaceae bacterium]